MNLELRSKGDPPQSLQQRIQQQIAALVTENYDELYSNYIYEGEDDESETDNTIDYLEFKPSQSMNYDEQPQSEDLSEDGPWHPFRSHPYATNFGEDDHQRLNDSEEPLKDATGMSIMVDDRTLNLIGNAIAGSNMGDMVKTAAKDWRIVVDGASKFVKNSIKKTFGPKKRPNFDLFGLLPNKNEQDSVYDAPNASYGSPSQEYGAPPDSSYGVPQGPPISAPIDGIHLEPPLATPAPVISGFLRTPQNQQVFSTVGPLTLDSYGGPQAAPIGPSQPSSTFSSFSPTISSSFPGAQIGSISPQRPHQSPVDSVAVFNPIGPSISSMVPPVNNQIPISSHFNNAPLQSNHPQNAEIQSPPTPSVHHVTTVNPFLTSSKPIFAANQNNGNTVNSVTTNFAQDFSEPIYRPRRNQFNSTSLRPGASPPPQNLFSTTLQPNVNFAPFQSTTIRPFPQVTTPNAFVTSPQPAKFPQVTTISSFPSSTIAPQVTTQRPFQASSIRDPSQFLQTNSIPFVSTTPQPTQNAESSQKEKDFRDVKLAWYNYYRKAQTFEQTYKEKVNVNALKKSFPKLTRSKRPTKAPAKKRPTRGPTRSTTTRSPSKKPTRRPRPTRGPTRQPTSSPTRPHPSPFSGLTQLQLPFVRPNNLPYFTLPSLLPKQNQRPAAQNRPLALNFNRPFGSSNSRKDALEDSHLDTMQAPEPDPFFQGTLTPAPSVETNVFYDIEKAYIYDEDEYQDHLDDRYNYLYDDDDDSEPVESQLN